jgi:carbon-monoxide dehydrogenase medium subunit
MYPSRFKYEAPTTIAEAIRLLGESGGDAKILAGGQSLIPMLNHFSIGPDGAVKIGALVRHADIERAEGLHGPQPTLAAAAPLVADPIVRNRGTFVGSLCHADPQGDWAAVMVALGGSVVAQGPNGKRTVAVNDLVSGPFQTVLAPDEIAIEAHVPAPKGTARGGYLKLERRVGDFATASVAVALDMQGDTVQRAGIGLAAVGAQTILAEEAAAAVTGGPLTEASIAEAADLAAAASSPRSDHRGSADYKRHIVHTFVSRLLTKAAGPMEKVA